MQFIEGRNVRQLVNGRPLGLASALSIAIQVTDALAAARPGNHSSRYQGWQRDGYEQRSGEGTGFWVSEAA